ncbi:hypothetical protein L0222_07975 [bacterium]|nr:hypothetical protein [bacterium]MCI0605768.1 hypothetical protein [bacterium]
MRQNKKTLAKMQQTLPFARKDIWRHLPKERRDQCRDLLSRLLREVIRCEAK